MPKLLIKICGISTPETVDAAVDAGADLVGFVFHPKSPRYVSPEKAALLAKRAGGLRGPHQRTPQTAQTVALLVDAAAELVETIASTVEPDFIQLHGSETPSQAGVIAAETGCGILKAIGVAAEADLAAAKSFAGVSDYVLVDAKPPKDAAYPGGHGKPFDWAILKALDPAIPFLLSGGLSPENVGDAICTIRGLGLNLVGVDVSSGVESAPGVKDIAKIRAFVAAVRAAG